MAWVKELSITITSNEKLVDIEKAVKKIIERNIMKQITVEVVGTSEWKAYSL